ncbi:hypothetical protein A1OE_864 [Candidatus Endolissoclinum faulkneri L2]|uniref:Uncharacterized protein n=1 Tax=Candidatus Endolissoclinum faulkneri L2 TaxID=1193729 RepID=K7Z4U6_9PROT|nr:hypothetical protein A1OE_864 [Candidatus Endolissoclinum faulkneri L2]
MIIYFRFIQRDSYYLNNYKQYNELLTQLLRIYIDGSAQFS